MKVLLASSEIIPFAKTGGLADVTGALPRELEKLGHEVTVFMPAYPSVRKSGISIESTGVQLEIPIGHNVEEGQLLKGELPNSNVTIYFVEHNEYFDRPSLYGENGSDYEDNCERFTFFSRSVLEAVRLMELAPDIIHVNDWQTGLIPALLECEYVDNPIYENIASLITIHNLAYQGTFDQEKMAITGLDVKYFNWEQMEFYGRLNLLKTGIVFADSINTVSPTYATEIQSSEQGCGLENVLRHRADRLSGILNGIDVSEWNPETDKCLTSHFSADFDIEKGSEGKAKCKSDLQIEAKLESNPDVPLIGIVGRLASQKGWSLILPVLKKWLANVDAQWVILGTGDPDYHHVLTSLHRSHPNKLALTLGFSNEFAHRIEAGSDLFLMPSQYEPCGLNQMYSMAYGTVPVVRRTGGLADTVVNATSETIENKTANGFCFDEFSAAALESSLHKAIRIYKEDPRTWNQLIWTGMNRDWSWNASAKQYEDLYRKTILHRSMKKV
ncbi:MAG: glycogen synthase GlgA [Mariniblastus sp.]